MSDPIPGRTIADVALYRSLYCRVSDAYGEMLPRGPYAHRSDLSDQDIQAHLDGTRLLGFYLVDKDGDADKGIFDVDVPKDRLDDSAAWKEASEKVRAITTVLSKHRIEFYVLPSRQRGWHIYIHANAPVPASLIRQFLRAIVKQAQVVNVEIFPKQDTRGGNDGLGNFVFGPLQGKAAAQGRTVIVDHENGLDPVPDSWEVLAGIKGNSLETFSAVLATIGEEKKGASSSTTSLPPHHDKLPLELLDVVFERCAEFDGMRRNAIEGGRLLPESDPGEHLARIRMANLYRAFQGGGERAVREVFSHLEDFNPRETEKHFASLRGAPPPCAELCPIDWCEAILSLGKSSPVAFAYEKRRAEGKVESPATAEGKKAPRPLFESLAALLANPLRPRWLIKGLIETPATGVIFGASGAGKSFVAVDLAGSCAAGVEWAGREVASPGPVYYIAGEGRGPLLRRFQAWQLNRKVTIPADGLFISSSRIELNDRGAAGVKGEIEQRGKETGTSPSLVLIDTMARALPSGSDENSAKDVGDFINTIDQIRDQFNCVVLIIHHSGHMEDKRARGSSALRAAMDVELCITKREGARIAEWTKLKDLPEEPRPQEFVLERVLVSAEADGELISSAVVSWQGQAARRTAIALTRAENLGLNTLTITIVKEGSSSTSLEAWREEFYSRHWGDSDAAKQKAFRRVRESLAGKNLIVVRDGLYSLPDKRTDTDISGHCPGASPDRHGHTPIGVSVCPALSGEECSAQYNLPRGTS